MKPEQVRELTQGLNNLPRLAETWLIMHEALSDVLSCARSQDLGHPERVAFIKNLAASALATVGQD